MTMPKNCLQLLVRVIITMSLPVILQAQATGRITGTVIDAQRGTPLPGATVAIDGTTMTATSRADGHYVILNVPVGIVAIRTRLIGYSPKTVTGILVRREEATGQDVALSAVAVEIRELTVTSQAENGTVRAALDEQRASAGVVNAITSEEMAKSPDGDASAAAQRLSGATIEGGRTLNMRGMGARYTTASQDGVRIPSPEPEQRTVPIDLFPTSLIETITVRKTAAPDLPGDFSGGSVDIRMKEFSGQRHASFSVSSGGNSTVIGTTRGFAPASSRDWLAFGASERSLPAVVAATDFSQALNSSQTNAIVNSFRRKWSVRNLGGTPNRGFGFSMGGNLPAPQDGISYLVSGNYSYSQETRSNEERAQAQPASSVGGSATAIDRYVGTTGRATVLWGGIANFGMTLGSNTKMSLHNMYNRTMDNEGRSEHGVSEKLGYPLEIQRLRYVERGIYTSQLAMHHEVTSHIGIDAAVTLSGVSRQEPDRSEIVYELSSGKPVWLGFSNEAAVRTFGALNEHSKQGDLIWRMDVGGGEHTGKLSFGLQYRTTDRDADNRAYSITLRRPLSGSDALLTPEQIFDGRFSGDTSTLFSVAPTSAGGSYTASDRQSAGFAMLNTHLTSALEITGGVRIEHSDVRVTSLSSAFEPSLAAPEYTDVLPSLAATYHAGEKVNLRFSASQTLSRPEYRELSPITYREVLGQDNIQGNAALKRALIQNYDLRWEFYPTPAEVFSVAAFVKEFRNPVERIYQGTSDQHLVTFRNARAAHNYGVELEARKRLDFLSPALATITGFTNVTLMHSRIQLDPTSGSLTNADRKMVSQAPYVINAGITWSHPTRDASATLLFNRVGTRISDAGEIPLPDVVEEARSVLDASVLLPLSGSLRFRIDGKNLLDAAYRVTQGGVLRQGYRAGRAFSIGFSWR